jgi:hypothetical protein
MRWWDLRVSQAVDCENYCLLGSNFQQLGRQFCGEPTTAPSFYFIVHFRNFYFHYFTLYYFILHLFVPTLLRFTRFFPISLLCPLQGRGLLFSYKSPTDSLFAPHLVPPFCFTDHSYVQPTPPPWRLSRWFPSKRWYLSTKPHGVTEQKNLILIQHYRVVHILVSLYILIYQLFVPLNNLRLAWYLFNLRSNE